MDQQIMIANKNNDILRRMNKDSQTILSKNKPQVRIIHIFAPEIIKTDPANFMELVQRLTGKSSSTRGKMIGKGNKNKKSPVLRNNRSDDHHGIMDRSSNEMVKNEEAAAVIWKSSSSSGGSGDYESGGFLKSFANMEDGFMQQLGLFQPSLDLLPNNHNLLLMHHHNIHRHHQQQHFFGQEDQSRSFDH